MAKPTKKSDTKVTRIVASEKAAPKPKVNRLSEAREQAKRIVARDTAQKSDRRSKEKPVDESTPRRNPLARAWRYLKGSWEELQQVRWPDRRSTWKMTGALIAFTLFFVVIILILDYGFSELFKLMLGN